MSESPHPADRWLRNLLVLLLAGLAVHVLLLRIAALEHSLHIIKGKTRWAVALAAGVQMLNYLICGVLLQTIVAMVRERLPVVQGTLITTAYYSIGRVAGGMVGSGATTYGRNRGSGVSAEDAFCTFRDRTRISASSRNRELAAEAAC